MRKEPRKQIDLGKAVDAVINFSDPDMQDDMFVKKLIEEIVSDDLAIRLGSTPDYETNVRRNAEESVAGAVKERGIHDRNGVITEAYNRSSNSQPRQPNFPYRNSEFLKGSDFARKHGG